METNRALKQITMNRKHFLRKAFTGLAGAMILPSLALAGGRGGNIPPKIARSGEGRKLNVLGDNMTLKLDAEDTGGLYTLIEQNNEPGVGIPLHVHSGEDEVFRIISGRVEFRLEEKTAVLGAGDMIFCPRGIPHAWKVVGDGPAKVDLSFFPAGLERMFAELARLPAGPPDMERVGEICARYGLRFV